jgi:hypothetical protein
VIKCWTALITAHAYRSNIQKLLGWCSSQKSVLQLLYEQYYFLKRDFRCPQRCCWNIKCSITLRSVAGKYLAKLWRIVAQLDHENEGAAILRYGTWQQPTILQTFILEISSIERHITKHSASGEINGICTVMYQGTLILNQLHKPFQRFWLNMFPLLMDIVPKHVINMHANKWSMVIYLCTIWYIIHCRFWFVCARKQIATFLMAVSHTLFP